MWVWVVFTIYVCMSACGLILIKIGVSDAGLLIEKGLIKLHTPFLLIFGLVLYICSFLVSLYVMNHMKLSAFYPLGTGAVLALTCLFGHLILKEIITFQQIIGIFLILCGVIAISIR